MYFVYDFDMKKILIWYMESFGFVLPHIQNVHICMCTRWGFRTRVPGPTIN